MLKEKLRDASRSLSLTFLRKTVRKMHSSRSSQAQNASSVVGIAITANHGTPQSNDIITVMETQWFCHRELKPGAWDATVRARVPILDFPFQSSHSKSNMCLWLGSLPWRASSPLSCGHKGHCWRGSLIHSP